MSCQRPRPGATFSAVQRQNANHFEADGANERPDEPVLVLTYAGVAVISVNDPDRRNAITEGMSAGLRAAVEDLEGRPDVHAIVVTGAGKAFCAGADLSALGVATEDGLRRLYDGFVAVADCALPTIAAVNGPAVGAGLNLALACDVRIAGPSALFDSRFQKLGLHPGGGMTWMLQRAVGPEVARAALLFGMSMDAEAAVRHGLALNVSPQPVDAALALAAGPASAPRDLVMATKATMRATITPGHVDSELHAFALDTELGPQASSIRSPEFAKRLTAASRPATNMLHANQRQQTP